MGDHRQVSFKRETRKPLGEVALTGSKNGVLGTRSKLQFLHVEQQIIWTSLY
jgi:hypothetical protein